METRIVIPALCSLVWLTGGVRAQTPFARAACRRRQPALCTVSSDGWFVCVLGRRRCLWSIPFLKALVFPSLSNCCILRQQQCGWLSLVFRVVICLCSSVDFLHCSFQGLRNTRHGSVPERQQVISGLGKKTEEMCRHLMTHLEKVRPHAGLWGWGWA